MVSPPLLPGSALGCAERLVSINHRGGSKKQGSIIFAERIDVPPMYNQHAEKATVTPDAERITGFKTLTSDFSECRALFWGEPYGRYSEKRMATDKKCLRGCSVTARPRATGIRAENLWQRRVSLERGQIL